MLQSINTTALSQSFHGYLAVIAQSLGCVIGGIAGMDAVLSIRASLIGPAYAVLVLALAGAVMIRFRRAAANLTRRQTASDPGPAAPIKDGRT